MSCDPVCRHVFVSVTLQGRPSQRDDFGAQSTAQTFPCERFDWMNADTDESLGAKVIHEILPGA